MRGAVRARAWAGPAAGPIVVRGRHRARVTADGQTQTIPIELATLGPSTADLEADWANARTSTRLW